MRNAILILVIFLGGCGISQQDVDATIAALPTPTTASTNTPTSYSIVFEVRSTLVNALFYDDLWEISWGRNANMSSLTYTALDVYEHNFQGPGYRVHWTQTIEAASGDTVTLTLQGYPETPAADCAIVVLGEDVSVATKGDGGGKAICESRLP